MKIWRLAASAAVMSCAVVFSPAAATVFTVTATGHALGYKQGGGPPIADDGFNVDLGAVSLTFTVDTAGASVVSSLTPVNTYFPGSFTSSETINGAAGFVTLASSFGSSSLTGIVDATLVNRYYQGDGDNIYVQLDVYSDQGTFTFEFRPVYLPAPDAVTFEQGFAVTGFENEMSNYFYSPQILPSVAFAEFKTIQLSSTVPEPASWALIIGGFGLIGATMRRHRVGGPKGYERVTQ